MTTPAQLSQALNRSAEQVCKHLLPHGKRIGHEWCAGDAYGGEGRSLKIVLDGDKAGVGSDFATGETFGDLLDLWCTTQSVGLGEAMAQACSFMGIVNDGQDSRPKKEYKRPPKPKSVQRLNKEGKVYQYLKSRGLTDQCLEDFRISEDQGQWIVFPYLREGLFINAKYIHIERTPEGKKQCRQEKDAEPCLFGWDALELRYPTTRFVVLTEGEVDCATYHQCGLPALSIPNGGGGGKKQDWIDQDYDRLSRFDTIYLSMDNDGPGKEAEKEIITRLGSERIRVIQLPYKDANECFAKGIKTFHRYLLSSKCLDPAELKPADYFTDDVLDKFFPKPGSYQGMKTPWKSVTNALTFQREELIVWTGFSGSGKSTALNQVAIEGMTASEKFCICSLEMPSKVTLYRMVRQITGEARPDEATIRRAMQWLNEKCWMVHILGTVKTQRVLEVFKYAVKRYDIRNFICDSLTKVGIREDDYDGQKSFVDQLCDFNHQYDSTTHLVVHQRKPESETNRPGKFGVRGAAAITDEASSVISIWRRPDPNDEEPQPTYGRKKKVEPSTEDHPPDTILSIVKNRETGVEGKFGLWFENSSLQYHEVKFPVSKSYLDRRSDVETF